MGHGSQMRDNKLFIMNRRISKVFSILPAALISFKILAVSHTVFTH